MKQGDNVTKTEKAIRQMETWARDDSHGYDQRYRWGPYIIRQHCTLSKKQVADILIFHAI